MKKPEWKKSTWVYLGLLAAVVLLNIAAWCSTAFCDWYIAEIFPIWINTYGRLTGMLPFSIGEIMLILASFLLAAAIFPGLLLLICSIFFACPKRRPRRIYTFSRYFYRFLAWTLAGVLLIMTLNCTILYHASTFGDKYFDSTDREYTLEELLAVRNYVVSACNEMSGQMERNENGDIIYTGDMQQEAIHSMQKLGKIYDGLSGYYPRPKALLLSDLMCQQYMQGYYFPFSMEANYNDVMYIMNKPATFCHELAHLKGYIYEDEANFIGYLACISSEDAVFRYSGYLSVVYYLDNDFYEAVSGNLERYYEEERLSPQVIADNIFVKQEEWDRINGKALVATEIVEAASESFTEASLKLNGVEDGMISYSRVVKLLLQYYEGILF